ncbi:hypothetical protein GCM10020258_29160 [Sphingomonas yabuuchiae]
MLIDPHPLADDRGLADDDTGAMVDEEMPPDSRARMDIDPGPLIGEFGDHPCHDRRAQLVQLMRDTVMQAGDGAGIAEQDLVDAARGGIGQKRRLDIAVDQFAHLRQRRTEQPRHQRRLFWRKGRVDILLPIGQLGADLAFQRGQRGEQFGRDKAILLLRRPRK